MAKTASGPKRLSYKVTNWRDYNESLVRRGDITFWFSGDIVDAWEHDSGEKKRGRPFTYSDVATRSLLVLRELFRPPYRQTEGLGRALARLMGAEVAIPDYTCLQKRAAGLGVAIDVDRARRGPVDVAPGSTGLKVYGEGEWKVKKHGVGKRRTWRKLHLAVDPDTHAIVAQTLTDNSEHDAEQVEALLDQTDCEVRTFYGDGAYDQWKAYDALDERGVDAIIPPRKNAKIKRQAHRPRLDSSCGPGRSWKSGQYAKPTDAHLHLRRRAVQCHAW